MLINCAFVGQKTLIFIEMHGTTTTKIIVSSYFVSSWLMLTSIGWCEIQSENSNPM
jgi:hypothetical protein